jgi:mannosyltransferase OCH1-like enzyme
MVKDNFLHGFSWFDEAEEVLNLDELNLDSILGIKPIAYEQQFDEAMGRFGHIYFNNQFLTTRNQQRYIFLRDLFVKNHPEITPILPHTLIPKIIHHIWIGVKPIPSYFEKYLSSWKKQHLGWEFKLWTNETVQNHDFKTRDLFDLCSNIAQKADILRYEILYQYGGIYVDTDFECINSFDSLIHQYDFFAGILPEYPPSIGIFKQKVATPTLQIMNALIGVRPNHPILEQTILNIRHRLPLIYESNRYDGMNFLGKVNP